MRYLTHELSKSWPRAARVHDFFFSVSTFFHKHSQLAGQQRKVEVVYLNPLSNFYSLCRPLDIRQAITEEDSPLYIANSRLEPGTLSQTTSR